MALQWGYLGCASFEVRTASLDVPWAGAASTSPSFVGKAGRSVLQGNPGPGQMVVSKSRSAPKWV